MLKNTNHKQKGFTIIEVLIVLAIAGLILLIVFLAVPALQRNARNTTMKSDAAAFAGGFSEYSANNNGLPVASVSQAGSVVTLGATGTNQATAQVNGSTVVTTTKNTAAPTTYTPGTLYWRTGITCAGTTSARSVVVYYWTETNSSSHTPSCVDGS